MLDKTRERADSHRRPKCRQPVSFRGIVSPPRVRPCENRLFIFNFWRKPSFRLETVAPGESHLGQRGQAGRCAWQALGGRPPRRGGVQAFGVPGPPESRCVRTGHVPGATTCSCAKAQTLTWGPFPRGAKVLQTQASGDIQAGPGGDTERERHLGTFLPSPAHPSCFQGPPQS